MKSTSLVTRLVQFAVLSVAVLGAVTLPAATVTVEVFSNFFRPTTTNINVGDTVTWVNRSGSHDTESDAGLWQSPFPLRTFSFTFTDAGTFTYRCNPHVSSGMRGTIIVRAAANNPPTISLTSPANGKVFIAPFSGVIEANASDADGSVAKVEFFANGVLLGTDSSAPFSLSLDNTPAGTYALTAKATDNLGATTTSAGVTISVIPPPSVTLAAPQRPANSQFRIDVAWAPASLAAIVQSSGDLKSWTPVHTNSAGGSFSFTDSNLGSAGARFYRVLVTQ